MQECSVYEICASCDEPVLKTGFVALRPDGKPLCNICKVGFLLDKLDRQLLRKDMRCEECKGECVIYNTELFECTRCKTIYYRDGSEVTTEDEVQ